MLLKAALIQSKTSIIEFNAQSYVRHVLDYNQYCLNQVLECLLFHAGMSLDTRAASSIKIDSGAA